MANPLRRTSDMGAGLSLRKKADGPHPSGPAQHGPIGQTERAFSAASTFLSGVLAISASQFIGAPLKLVDPKFYDGYMAWTKESFAVLCTTMTQWWSPTVVRVTGDDSMKGQLYKMDDGTLKCNFPHRMVLMANHQLYTDWLYLWWIAYTNKMHGRIYIILKESLKNIPIFGWGAQFYNFIFLSRKWETDRPRFKRHLAHLMDPKDPMWLLIFPEGTNLSKVTREKSKKWADKTGVPDMKHQLLPRSTGLQFCLQELQRSTNWLYDCTIAYEGVPPGQYGQDIYTLRSSFFEGRPPKSVNMYWRRFRISEIPLDDDKAFAMWLRNRWTEKDYILDYFFRHGAFPEGDPVKAMKTEIAVRKFALSQSNGDQKSNITPTAKFAKFITTEVKAGGWEEFMSIFGPVTSAATAITNGSLSPENMDLDTLLNGLAQSQQLGFAPAAALPKVPRSQEEMVQALLQASKLSGTPIKKETLEYLTGGGAARMLQNGQSSASTPRSLPAAPKPTAGKRLDPEVQKLIEDAHEETRRRLLSASTPTKKNATPPNVRRSIPMAPMETLVTRPISTIALQRAAPYVKRFAEAGQAGQAGSKKAGTSAAVAATKRPAVQRAGSVQTGVSSVNGGADATRKKIAAATKTTQKHAAIGTVKYKPGTGPAKKG